MTTRHIIQICLVAAAVATAIVACGRSPESGASGQARQEQAESAPAITNRVDIPQTVRQNLGITFAKVESRHVARTLRVPGRFELLPTAQREYRAPASGRVELLVSQYAVVDAGTPLYRLDAPRWREMQKELADAHADVRLAEAGAASIGPLLEAHEQHHTEIEKAVALWTSRVETLEQLRDAGGARGDEIAQAKAALASARSELAETLEKEAELAARAKQTAAALDAANARLAFLFEAAAALTGLTTEDLRAPASSGAREQPRPRWAVLAGIEVRAQTPGIVEHLHAVSGGFVDEHAPVLETVQPEMVRFRAAGLQSDLARLNSGQSARVIAAGSGAPSDEGASLAGTLLLAPTADAERRTIDLIFTPASGDAAPPWARAGVSAFLEVVTAGVAETTGEAELAIPLRAVARDGTRAVIFRRDPANPDKAIRLEADLGIDDGRWIVIKSGVAEGNEVVLDGVYQLMAATSGSITKGGHFHPDGTFHEGDD
ncbi:MAG: efflux RND transporter periplasmic adaptor subunit [Phycisphaerales bacterium]